MPHCSDRELPGEKGQSGDAEHEADPAHPPGRVELFQGGTGVTGGDEGRDGEVAEALLGTEEGDPGTEQPDESATAQRAEPERVTGLGVPVGRTQRAVRCGWEGGARCCRRKPTVP